MAPSEEVAPHGRDSAATGASDAGLRQLSEGQNLALGIATGCAEQPFSQPLLYFKNSHIQGLPLTLNPLVVFRGTFAATWSMASLTGIQFISSGIFQKLIVGDANAKMSWGQEVGCAFLGGAISGPAASAFELVMIQQQRFGGSLLGTASRVIRAHGPLGLMRGLTGATGREALYTAGYLGTVPATQRYCRENLDVDPRIGNFAGAMGGGLLCALVSQPLDTAKTCMQGDIERKKYKGMVSTMRTLHQEYGSVTAFYRGYWWRSSLIIFDFLALDFLAKLIGPLMFPGKM